MAGLTREGFERKRLSDIKSEIESALKTQFGGDIDLRAESVFGQIVGVLSLPISELWEEAENVYLSFDPDYASGVSLDSLAALTGITRIAATSTQSQALLFGNSGTIVPANAEARNGLTQDVFYLENEVAIGLTNLVRAKITVNNVSNSTDYTITINSTDYTVTSDSSATRDEILLAFDTALSAVAVYDEVNVLQEIVLIQDDLDAPFSLSVSANLTVSEIASAGNFIAKIAGQTFLPSTALNEIQTSVAGWSGVLNPADGVTGRNIETDSELRLRRRQSVSFPATATIDSLNAKLLEVENVTAVSVFENTSDATDANGLSAHHIWIIIQGGDVQEIADIIYRTKAAGIGTFGDTTINYVSDSSQTYEIKIERPTETPLYIDMTISPTEGYDTASPTLIKESIVKWVAENLSIGEGLKYSRLYTPINETKGFEVTELLVGKSANPTGEASIPANIDEILTAATENIIVAVNS